MTFISSNTLVLHVTEWYIFTVKEDYITQQSPYSKICFRWYERIHVNGKGEKHTWRCKCWLLVIGKGWLRVWIVIFSLRVANLRIAAFIKLMKVGAECWQEPLWSTVYPRLPSLFLSSITTAPYLQLKLWFLNIKVPLKCNNRSKIQS